MKLGLRRGTVAVEPHNSEWEVTAQQTIAQLREILGNTAADIQHIGSTSIKNICAKPIIDIVVGVRDFRDILELNAVLEDNGFIFRGQDVPDQYLYVCGDEDSRTHHIHTVIYDSEAWNNYINLRDYLNCHKAEAQAYSELKEKLARQYPDDRNTYTELKSGLIAEILAKAHDWRCKSQLC
ncbi:GrpB family protein [Ruminococcus flavefaciens]|uniref:GrpB family protein n=1 Tax=Ruminococcus flavefaciens TaxID=1265 RepID=UPI0026EF1F9A|nr:GrpB family protein [Ruminococcus flavefaciens]